MRVCVRHAFVRAYVLQNSYLFSLPDNVSLLGSSDL